MRERVAFVRGVEWDRIEQQYRREFDLNWANTTACGSFPFPTITRPRVVSDPAEGAHRQFRVSDGILQYRGIGEPYWLDASPARFRLTAAHVALWHSLYESPDETLEDDGSQSVTP